MTRDMDVIRAILLAGEAPPDAKSVHGLTHIDGVDAAVAAYHVALLKDAGYVEATVDKKVNGLPWRFMGLRLTWSGHEFLDAMRDDTVWKKVKDHMIKPGVSWTVSLLFEALKNEARIRLRLPPPP
jgi:hypothetical protein